MWHKSSIKEKLQNTFLRLQINDMLYIYKDPAYGSAYSIISLYCCTSSVLARLLSQEQLALNKAIAKV
jgi:hypothetical protein